MFLGKKWIPLTVAICCVVTAASAGTNRMTIEVLSRSGTDYNDAPSSFDGPHASFVWVEAKEHGLGMFRDDNAETTKGYFGYFPDLEGPVVVTSSKGRLPKSCGVDYADGTYVGALVGWRNKRADLLALASRIRCPNNELYSQKATSNRYRIHEESGGVGLVRLTVSGRSLAMFELPQRPMWTNERFRFADYRSILMTAWTGTQFMAYSSAVQSDDDRTSVFVADKRCTAGIAPTDFKSWSAIIRTAAETEPDGIVGLAPASVDRGTSIASNRPSTVNDFHLPDLCKLA
jgi:hypothetical protein